MSRKDVAEFIEHARENGFRNEGITGSGHWKLVHRSGAILIVPATPRGGSRWQKNLTARVKRINRGAS